MSRPSPLAPSGPFNPPHLSVVVPLFNCLSLTQAMLASLQATIPAGLSHEIILVDDGSTDGTREWLGTLSDPPFRVLINDRNLGYAATNNRGAAIARGELLVLLNNDLVLLPGWLQPMLKAQRRLGPRAGLIGNVQRNAATGCVDHAGITVTCTGKPVHVRRLPPLLSRLLRPIRPTPAVTAACLIIARDLWLKLGGFDEAFFNGGEDIDLCFRARALGRINAVALRSVVHHHISASPGRKLRDEENSRRLVRRWQRELLEAGADPTREWCRNYLSMILPNPRSIDFRLAVAACLHAAGLRRAPAEAIAGVTAGQAEEFARWDAMFPDSAPSRQFTAGYADEADKGIGGRAPG
ncbi:MAG: glycosyltransferase family 2 protein [Opitutus sp.]